MPAKSASTRPPPRPKTGRPRRPRTGGRAASPPAEEPHWGSIFFGLLLLVPAWVLSQTFFTSLCRSAVDHAFWKTEEFWFFTLGAVLWLLWFIGSLWAFGDPWPIRPYVFGHELSHAVWVWMMRGRVERFVATSEGGYIITRKSNFWIALAPYFYPIYSIALLVLYAGASFFYNLSAFPERFWGMTVMRTLYLLLGISWSFHFSFTCWMIPKGQSDLTAHGTFFSLVVIYLMNVLLLSFLLIQAAGEVTTANFAQELWANTQAFGGAILDLGSHLRK